MEQYVTKIRQSIAEVAQRAHSHKQDVINILKRKVSVSSGGDRFVAAHYFTVWMGT